MSGTDPTPFIDKLVGVCLSLLVGAAAVYIAVQLIEAVWTALLVILGVGVFLAVAGMVLRSRNRGW
jgi:hypothetical protein